MPNTSPLSLPTPCKRPTAKQRYWACAVHAAQICADARDLPPRARKRLHSRPLPLLSGACSKDLLLACTNVAPPA